MASHYERTIHDLSLALSNLLDALPKCQHAGCDKTATREDCNLLLGCDDDEHCCLGDGGPQALPWANAALCGRRILEGC